MTQKYEKKVIPQDGSFKKSYNFKPITALNGSDQGVKQPKQSNGQSPQSSVEIRGGGKS